MVVVKRPRGVEVQFGGQGPQGWLPPGAVPPRPTPVHVVKLDLEIFDDGDEFTLAWTGPSRDYCNDARHETIDAALEEARLRFGIEPSEWDEGADRVTVEAGYLIVRPFELLYERFWKPQPKPLYAIPQAGVPPSGMVKRYRGIDREALEAWSHDELARGYIEHPDPDD